MTTDPTPPAAHAAVIFDLDGTLTKPHLDFDAIRAEIGIESGPILEAVARLDPARQAAAREILQRHELEAAHGAALQKGAIEVIEQCRRRGFAVAILTRNSRAIVEIVMANLGLRVDAVRAREDGAIKPSPQPVRSLCRQLGAETDRSWMVGDHLFDIQSGRAAGSRTVLFVNGGEAPPYADQADFIIHGLHELLPILDAAGSRDR